jgi:DNA-binding NtrC family response regulator/tetratricopeptide (TPR) repeat protein
VSRVRSAADVDLFADRFVMTAVGSAIDLATGDRVTMTIGKAGGAAEQAQWVARCDALQKLRHRSIARLVDFGAIGRQARFEAWRCGGSPDGARAVRDAVCRRARDFLQASGLTPGVARDDSVRSSTRGPVILLPPDAGYPHGAPRLPEASSIDAYGLTIVDRPAVTVIAELFEATGDSAPRIVSLRGPAGAGKTVAVGELARAARLNGLVPVSAAMLQAPFSAALRGRTLFIIDDEAGVRDRWASLVEWALRSPRPHVMLVTGCHDEPWLDGILLDPVSPDALAGSIRPAAVPPALLQQIARAAARADGNPGRFAASLWGSGRDASHPLPSRAAARGSLRAAERHALYAEENEALRASPLNEPRTWPAPGELASLRRRMDGAIRQLAEGRHAAGERALRQSAGSLLRRGDWAHAGRGSFALASSLLKRGQTQSAQAALDQARDCSRRAGHDGLLVDVATLSGHAWIDLARLDEAESVIGAARAAAAAAQDVAKAARASLAMARCLFWRGRYGDADAILSALPRAGLPDRLTVSALVAASRLSVGLGDFGRAVSSALEARERAGALRDPDVVADAAAAAAFAHLAVNDYGGVARDADECILAARAARSPLQAIRARLLFAESERRQGRRAAAVAVVKRVKRVERSLPPIVRARCDLLADLLEPGASAGAVADRHTGASGLAALALLMPRRATSEDGASIAGMEGVIDEIVGILHLCQNAEEDLAVLTGVCARLRSQLHAAAVAFIIVEHGAPVVIAADGGRLETAIAQRAMAAGIAIPPHRTDDRLEAAAPVRCGGATIGALMARWTLGTPHNLSRAPTMLMMAATAAAPAAAGAVSRRAGLTQAGPTELLGSSGLMRDLRRAIERAAAAPFCVLIEGESGSGKELVARAVHGCGPRRDRAWCALNCAALPDDLVESELFGHARGAFTGAVGERPGVFEEAHAGTLFLDEIGELSLRAQAKVLRVIQDGELRRVGENVSRRVDVRIVAATNRDLRQEVAAGRFRLDLLYRLDVIRLLVAPLRDRREDIALLADHFWRDAAARVGSRATLGATTVAALGRYDWPGNVRELQNVLAALAVRTPKRGIVPPTALTPQFGEYRSSDAWRLDDARRGFDERFVRAALARTGGRRAEAAAELGVTRQGLTKLMTRLGITDRPNVEASA